MQIATSLFYSSAAKRMVALTDRASVLQTQIATGKRVQNPSEDAALAQQVAEFDRKDADTAVYKTNMDLSSSLLDQADGILTQIGSQIQRALELATQAGNGTQTTDARKIIGVEISSVIDSLVGLANTRNVRGQPLFGTADGIQAVTRNPDGTFTFAPTNVSEVPIGDGQSVQSTESAARIFKLGSSDTLTMLSALAKTLSDGDPLPTDALSDITDANEQAALVQASVGARGARIELQQTLLTNATTDRQALRSNLEDADITSSVTELQKIMTVLSATQASFSKLASLSLFDYLR